MNINLTPIFQAIIALIASLITYKLIPLIRSKTNANQRTLLNATIRTLVFAAEQLYGAGNGKDKLRYVSNELLKRGFIVDVAAIEGAVKELFNSPFVNKLPEETE